MMMLEHDARSILTPTGGFLGGSGGGGYTHSLNPAIGCPYGLGFCGQFCYARVGMAQRFAEQPGAWGEVVRIKRNAADLLRRELERAAARDSDHQLHVGKLRIFASSSTDPCAGPILPVFRECLRVLAGFAIERIVIQTRSPQVLKLRDEIEALGERAVVSITIETDSDEIWSRGPRGSPGISQRMRVVEAIGEWRTALHVTISPVLPMRDAVAFADWIAEHADHATVDTFTAGDGSGGRRTAGLPLPQIAEAQGWDWRDERAARELLALLEARMPGRVGWSCGGFARLAARDRPG